MDTEEPIITSIRISVRPLEKCFVPFQNGEYLRAVVYEIMKKHWSDIHDTNDPKPFSINPLVFPPNMQIERKSFVVYPHIHAYFDVVVYGSDNVKKAIKEFRQQTRKYIKIGDTKFQVVSVRYLNRSQKFLNQNIQNGSRVDFTLKTPLVFIGDGYGMELALHQLNLHGLLTTPLKIYNSIAPHPIHPEVIKQESQQMDLLVQESKIQSIRFPLHNEGKQLVFTGLKGKIAFKGKVGNNIAKLVALANWVNIGYGRTMGLGKVYGRVTANGVQSS